MENARILSLRRSLPKTNHDPPCSGLPLIKKRRTLKTRKYSNSEKPDEWKDFIRDMDLWIMVYDALTFLAKHKLMGALALKAHVQNSEIAYHDLLSARELSFFKEVLRAKTNDYDPDTKLNELLGEVVCVELNPQSHLREQFGCETICGKFINLNSGKAVTRIRSEESGQYEEKEAAFSFRLAYPDAEHFVDVSLLDLVNIEPFL